MALARLTREVYPCKFALACLNAASISFENLKHVLVWFTKNEGRQESASICQNGTAG